MGPSVADEGGAASEAVASLELGYQFRGGWASPDAGKVGGDILGSGGSPEGHEEDADGGIGHG